MTAAEGHNKYIGRIAPSPTGLLHLGHAATFWAAHERARQHNGALLLRNEDLDPQRSRPEFVEAMIEDLAWLGIVWQPPMLSQSARLAAYRAAFERLLATGLVYRCTCSRRELAQSLEAPHEDLSAESQPANASADADAEAAEPAVGFDPDDGPIYSGRCRPLEPTPIAHFTPGNYRLRVPGGETVPFNDGNLGPQSFTALAARDAHMDGSNADVTRAFGDFLIWRRPLTGNPDDVGLPSYQLACVVDDAFQQVTEVVRGADLLKSTARQILLQRALGLATPAYFHTQLVRDRHGVRLAKRHDALALRTLRVQGLSAARVEGLAAEAHRQR